MPLPNDEDEFLTARDVMRRLKVSRVTLWEMCKSSRFPQPVKAASGGRHGRNFWLKSAVNAWFERQAETCRGA